MTVDEAHYRTLKRFQESSSVIQFALDTRDNSITPFPRTLHSKKERDEYRELCKEHFVCIVESCREPLNPHFRTARTPGYVHVNGARAHGESAWHELAELLVVQWAKDRGASAQRELKSPDVTRTPDVTVVTPTGSRIAVEIQYSALTAELFAERHRDLSVAYDSVVWLLGHSGPNFSLKRNGGGELFINKLARCILDSGLPLLWINPTDAGAILTPWEDTPHGPRYPRGRSASKWEITSLSECWLDDTAGIVTPAADRISDSRARRERRERAARERDEQDRLQLQREREKARALWEQSDDRRWIAAEHSRGRTLPLTSTCEGDQSIADRLGVTCEHWKTRVLRHVSHSSSWVGWTETCGALNQLAQHGPIRLSLVENAALERYLRDLGGLGLIIVHGKDHRPTVAALHMGRSRTQPRRPRTPQPAPESPSPPAPLSATPEPIEPTPVADESTPPAQKAPRAEPTPAPVPAREHPSRPPSQPTPSTPREPRRQPLRRFLSYLFGR